MDPNVERLVVRCRDGDPRAFDGLVERFQRRVFYTIFRVVRDAHLADDLTQEVFITVFRRMGTLKDPASFPSWLLRTAMNRAIDARRKSKREQDRVFLLDDFTAVGDGAEGPSPTETKACEVDEAERTQHLERQLREAIDALPDGQRRALLLSMDEHLSHDAIAEILEIPKGTVKSRLHHARKFQTVKLRSLLEGV